MARGRATTPNPRKKRAIMLGFHAAIDNLPDVAPATWRQNGDENEDLYPGRELVQAAEIYPFRTPGASPFDGIGRAPGDDFGGRSRV
jgi:hypothetical protein